MLGNYVSLQHTVNNGYIYDTSSGSTSIRNVYGATALSSPNTKWQIVGTLGETTGAVTSGTVVQFTSNGDYTNSPLMAGSSTNTAAPVLSPKPPYYMAQVGFGGSRTWHRMTITKVGGSNGDPIYSGDTVTLQASSGYNAYLAMSANSYLAGKETIIYNSAGTNTPGGTVPNIPYQWIVALHP